MDGLSSAPAPTGTIEVSFDEFNRRPAGTDTAIFMFLYPGTSFHVYRYFIDRNTWARMAREGEIASK